MSLVVVVERKHGGLITLLLCWLENMMNVKQLSLSVKNLLTKCFASALFVRFCGA